MPVAMESSERELQQYLFEPLEVRMSPAALSMFSDKFARGTQATMQRTTDRRGFA